jgi:lipooligosaccharide transport system permease protein
MTALSVPRHTTRRVQRGSPWWVVEYNLVVARSFWRSILIVGFANPLLYVLALGVGLGSVVDHNGHQLGVKYLVFVAPAFLTATALQIAAQESAFPVMAGFKWLRTYHGMAATPLSPEQICEGLLISVAIRVFANSALYLAIMAAFGGTERWAVVLAVPVATLTATAFSSWVLALGATIESEGNAFNLLFRFVVTPMFLFSGTFYPIDQLPRWGQYLAYVSPLWHGTELARGAAIGGLSGLSALGHIGYLLLWLVPGALVARRQFRVRLTK